MSLFVVCCLAFVVVTLVIAVVRRWPLFASAANACGCSLCVVWRLLFVVGWSALNAVVCCLLLLVVCCVLRLACCVLLCVCVVRWMLIIDCGLVVCWLLGSLFVCVGVDRRCRLVVVGCLLSDSR